MLLIQKSQLTYILAILMAGQKINYEVFNRVVQNLPDDLVVPDADKLNDDFDGTIAADPGIISAVAEDVQIVEAEHAPKNERQWSAGPAAGGTLCLTPAMIIRATSLEPGWYWLTVEGEPKIDGDGPVRYWVIDVHGYVFGDVDGLIGADVNWNPYNVVAFRTDPPKCLYDLNHIVSKVQDGAK